MLSTKGVVALIYSIFIVNTCALIQTFRRRSFRSPSSASNARRNAVRLHAIEPPLGKSVDGGFNRLERCLKSTSLPKEVQSSILSDLKKIGFLNSDELYDFARDFVGRPEALSTSLQTDFGMTPLRSHQVRSVLMRLIEDFHVEHDKEKSSFLLKTNDFSLENSSRSKIVVNNSTNLVMKRASLFKSVIVNGKAKRRHSGFICDKDHDSRTGHLAFSQGDTKHYNYGVSPDFDFHYPTLAGELQEFMMFMVQPSANSQEPTIRTATAAVYLRHTKLFLGWYLKEQQSLFSERTSDCSLRNIFPNSESSSAQPIVSFILWLRKEREISDSYEANMLRGLTKMLKYRFVHESRADPTYGEKSFHDIPVIRELRKLHKEANKRQTLSSRSSDEALKWLTWLEYLQVVESLKADVTNEIDAIKANFNESQSCASGSNVTPTQRRIASKYQNYLIVAIFAYVPDRQRTIRELELGRTLLRDDKLDCWVIKHGPLDYKTGGIYGDRPPLILAKELTYGMDDFLRNWRPCLRPSGSHFFTQIRTGRALTQDSVYSIVARSCFMYTGKKTNPHLLRDMIVTHVRNSKASEKELEALALYMGHSVAMQRTSYDRRTIQQKVAPAIDLLRTVNEQIK